MALPIVDNFNRASGSLSGSTTSDGQATWGSSGGYISGTWSVTSDIFVTCATSDGIITLESGASGTSGSPIRISVKLDNDVEEQGICFRATSATSHCRAVLNAGTCYVQTKNGGSYSTVTTASHSFAVGDTMSVLLSGTDVSVERNGTAFIGPVTVSHNSTATSHGLAVAVGGDGSRWDDFEIESVSGGGGVGGDPYGSSLQDAIVSAIEAQATNGILKIYSNATAGLGTVLAEITLPADCFSAVSAGAITKNGTWSTTALASGTPLSFCLFKSDGTTPLHQGSCGYTGSGADLILDNGGGSSAITSGDAVTVSAWTYTAPDGT
jgi:hypothetical protein